MPNMLGQLVSDVSVLRRILFAVVHLPPDCPRLWEIAVHFGTGQKGSQSTISPAQVRVLFENFHELNLEAFVNDDPLLQELSQRQSRHPHSPHFISPRTECYKCRGVLSLRADRPSRIPRTQYHKYCHKARCKVHQYYGYHTKGELYYDGDWLMLPYFMSTQRTAFSVTLLKKYDSELL